MCRLLGYVGPPVRLDGLLLDPEHSLVVQSHSPREMSTAVLNADGFGLAWYTSEATEPALYRSVMPMWGDDNLPRMAKHLRSACVLANVRSATPGIDVSMANTQPFVWGDWAFAHNGYVRHFRPVAERRMREGLRDEAYAVLGGTSDSQHLFAHLIQERRPDDPPSTALVDALRRCLGTVSTLLTELDVPALLNVTVTDGARLVAARHAVGDAAPSLYLLENDRGAHLIASEPTFEDPGWRPLREGEVVQVDAGGAARFHSL